MAGTALAASAASYNRVLGANDTVRLGLIGCGGRGRGVTRAFQKNPTVKVTAACDVYSKRIDQVLASA